MKKVLIFFLIASVAAGCVCKIELKNSERGQVLHGKFNEANNQVSVTMPDGDIREGIIYTPGHAAFSFGSGIEKGDSSSLITRGKNRAYALLTSENSHLMMEMIVTDSVWTLPGSGEARLNDGRTYQVHFMTTF